MRLPGQWDNISVKLRQWLLQEKLHKQIRVDVTVVTDDVTKVTLRRLGNGRRSVAFKFRSHHRRDVKPESSGSIHICDFYVCIYNTEVRSITQDLFWPDPSHALSLQG